MLKVLFGKVEDILNSSFNDRAMYSDRLKSMLEKCGAVQGYCHVAGETLLKVALQQQSRLNIAEDVNGKPYLVDEDVFFNLSDYGHWVACAVCDGDVGVDVMVANVKVASVISRYATKEEMQWIDEGDKQLRSAFLWSVRESAVKYSGLGIRAMSSVSVLMETLTVQGENYQVEVEIGGVKLRCFGFVSEGLCVVATADLSQRALFFRL